MPPHLHRPGADNVEAGREGFNAVVNDPRDFTDTYLPAFQSCAQRAGSSGVMCACKFLDALNPSGCRFHTVVLVFAILEKDQRQKYAHIALSAHFLTPRYCRQCGQWCGVVREQVAAVRQASRRLSVRRICHGGLQGGRGRLVQEHFARGRRHDPGDDGGWVRQPRH